MAAKTATPSKGKTTKKTTTKTTSKKGATKTASKKATPAKTATKKPAAKKTPSKADTTKAAKEAKGVKVGATKKPNMTTIPGTKIKARIGKVEDKKVVFYVHESALHIPTSGPLHDEETDKYIAKITKNKKAQDEDGNLQSVIVSGVHTPIPVTIGEDGVLNVTRGRKRKTWANLAEKITGDRSKGIVPVIYDAGDESTLFDAMFIENYCRVERSPMEKARDVGRWFNFHGLKTSSVEDKKRAQGVFGCSRTALANYIRLSTKADDSVQRALEDEALTLWAAMDLLKGNASKAAQREGLEEALTDAGYTAEEVAWYLEGDDEEPTEDPTEDPTDGDDPKPKPKKTTKKKNDDPKGKGKGKKPRVKAKKDDNAGRAQAKDRVLTFVQTVDDEGFYLEDPVRCALLWAVGAVRDEVAREFIPGFDEILRAGKDAKVKKATKDYGFKVK